MKVVDPRLAGAKELMKNVGLKIPVVSSKGGVGKTLLSVLLALNAACRLRLKTGLLDLDITNPTAHVVLGVKAELEEVREDKGVVPPEVCGVKFMTTAFFTGENPNPLRGFEIDNVIKEVLATTVWGELDVLFIDTPPGLGDEILDILDFLEKPPVVIVATPSKMAVTSVKRLVKLLEDECVKRIFLLENMSLKCKLKSIGWSAKTIYVGCIPIDYSVEENLGNPLGLLETTASKSVLEPLKRILDNLATRRPP